jgi:hypothetical protein
MTIINGIEIDHFRNIRNPIREAIQNNDPIEEKLHVIAVISNPCMFAKRYILMREFISRLKREKDAILYIVELAYDNQPFIITSPKNPHHLQLRTETPLWHKENMINLGVRNLLPKEWKAFAWIDADLEFDSDTWCMDTLKILNGHSDIVQLFSHAIDMDSEEMAMRIFTSAGYMHSKQKPYVNQGPNQWHPGFAWAMTRKAYEKVGGLYQDAILGSGDNLMMLSIIGESLKGLHALSSDGYKESVKEYEENMSTLRFAYVPGVIRHYFHGSKKNRKYHERWMILVEHDYNPRIHIHTDEKGLIVPTCVFPEQLKKDIFQYFLERNEDE